MIFPTRINKKSLNIFKEKLFWKGSGKQLDPIIIDSLEGFNDFIKFKNISNYILIENIKLWEIKLTKCDNITIDNCEIQNLKILGSYHITVKNSKILKGYLSYCRESVFQNNVFDRDWANLAFSEKELEISNKGRDRIQKVSFGLFIIIILISILFFIFLDLFSGIYFLIISLCPLIIVRYYRNKKNFVKNLSPNSFENNKSEVLEELRLKSFPYQSSSEQ